MGKLTSEVFNESCCEGQTGGICDITAKSAQTCGCDPGENYLCARHREGIDNLSKSFDRALDEGFGEGLDRRMFLEAKPILPTTDNERKRYPVFSGLLMYFPLACMEVANVSRFGNEQHNPGEPMHWAREKSTDQLNTAIRHIMDHGTGNIKDDGGQTYHLAKAIWRLCAELQLTVEKEKGHLT